MESKIVIGMKYEHDFNFTQKDVITFADASGDYNPIHLDKIYAKKSIFKKTIIHGFLGGSVFSKVFGTLFPGNGTIYLRQNLSFLKPMFVDEKYIAKFEVIETNIEKNRAKVKTVIIDSSENIVIDGEALIKHCNIY